MDDIHDSQRHLLPWMFVFAWLLTMPGTAKALEHCPSGTYLATPLGAPVTYCAPTPHDRQGKGVAPQPGASHWGAIAVDDGNPVDIGSSAGLSTKQQAKRAALADCNAKAGKACKVEIAYGDGCAALVQSNDGHLLASADVTRTHATQSGMKACADAGHPPCRVIYAACSPARSQADSK
ncbi:DUF4189 domain-containing protein [Dyella sp. A6]|uniref:DUF4189 domain-containing protein n=1 Tax=Dyella aluminiiresistens TaxID=3069105 RepID=UPI002E77779C|nr:DUF4189 domain-containing protein [Dyella sp. A6]